MEQLRSKFSRVESKFDHLINYVNENKSLRGVIGFKTLDDDDILAP